MRQDHPAPKNRFGTPVTDAQYALRRYCSAACRPVVPKADKERPEVYDWLEGIQKLAHADLVRFRRNGVKTDGR